jgi:hypothetical protein
MVEPLNLKSTHEVERQSRAARILPLAGLVALCLLFIGLTFERGLWVFPLTRDASNHTYVGQRMLAGALPYRDFVQFQPPVRLAVSWVWAAVAQITGIPVVYVGRGLSLAAAVVLLLTQFGIGTEFTGQRSGGLLAVVVLIGLDTVSNLSLRSPNVRMTAALFAALGIWMSQSRRWVRAGVLLGLAVFMWFPAASLLAGVLGAAFLQKGQPRLRSVLKVVTGAGAIALAVILVLAIFGLLDDAYRQSVLGTMEFLGRNSTDSADGGWQQTISKLFASYGDLIRNYYTDDFVLLALIPVGLLTTIVRRCIPQAFSDPATTAPLLACMFLLSAFLIDLQGEPDAIMMLPLLAACAAAALTDLLVLAASLLRIRSASMWTPAAAVIAAALLIYGLTGKSLRFDAAQMSSLNEQQHRAEALNAALTPGLTVQALDGLWFPVLLNQANPTRYNWIGGKINAAITADGSSLEQVVTDIEAVQPAVVILDEPRGPFKEWAKEHYVRMGRLDEQAIYVRKGHNDLIALISQWPLRDR